MKLGHRRMPLGLTTTVLGGLILSSCLASASFIEHNGINIESKLLASSPPSRGGPTHHHGIGGHRHRARLYKRRTEGVLVEVPYTIWAGTFADLIKRSPGASFDSHDNHYTHLESRGKHDKVLCIGIFCKDGYYCSDAGCCPEGSECTGITTCLDATDHACPKDIACCPKANPICKITGSQGFCVQDKGAQEPTTTSKTLTPTHSVDKGNPTTTKQHTTSIGGSVSTTTTLAIPTQTSTTVTSSAAAIIPPAVILQTSSSELPTPNQTPVENSTNTSTAPTPSSTKVVHQMSDGSKIIAGVIAGSIVFIAFGSMILYAIVKKRRERAALAGLEEEKKTEPMSGTKKAAPMGVGGQNRRLSIQPGPEVLQTSDRSVEAGNNPGTGTPPVPSIPRAKLSIQRKPVHYQAG